MNENTILEKASEAGFMINKEAVSYLMSRSLSEEVLPELFSKIDGSVFVIEPCHLTEQIRNFEERMNQISAAAPESNAGFTFKYPFETNSVTVLEDISEKTTSIGEYNQYVQYFRDRYTRISEMIRSRVSSARPIESIKKGKYIKPLSRDGNSDVTIIGMVAEKSETNNQHIVLTLEDPTDVFSVLVNRNDSDLIEIAERLVLDEIVGVTGTVSQDGAILMASQIIQPDVPNNYRPDRLKSEGYALFISDIHIGSKEFMKPEWETFIDFLNGLSENEKLQKIASEIRYLIVAGDIVDGIGIYPGQENDLEILEIHDQYEAVAAYFHQIPKNIHVVIAPGNHDAVRRAEPQTTFSSEIRSMFPENVTFVGNPAVVSLDGITLEIYHGCSMDDLVANVKGVSYQEPTTGMKEMVKRRHLAPTYGSRVMISPEKRDYLVIDKVPDIIHCGHVHTVGVSNYKNILLINSGTWQAQTDFQKRVNIMPTPAKVPFVDLKTMKPGIMDFNSTD